MATFNRFQRATPARAPAPDDDDELAEAARRRMAQEAKPPPAPTVKAPTGPAAAPVAKPAPVVKPAPAPVAKVKPEPVVKSIAPVVKPTPAPRNTAPLAPTPAPRNEVGSIHTEAVRMLDEEDDAPPPGINNPYEEAPTGKATSPLVKDTGKQTSAMTSTRESRTSAATARDRAVEEARARNAAERARASLARRSQSGSVADEIEREGPTGGPTIDDLPPALQPGGGGLTQFPDAADMPADEGDDDLEAAARLRQEQDAERNAARDDLAAGKAKALMMANARAQLAGMGLSGATAALESDIGRTQDRSAVLAMSELGRRQRDEGREDRRLETAETRADADAAFVELQREIAIRMLEEELGEDVDGDGKTAGQTDDERTEEERKAEALQRIAEERADERAREAGLDDVSNDRARSGTPDDAENYEEWTESTSPPWGYRTGSDSQYVYVMGLDGRLWKVPLGLYAPTGEA